MEMFQGALKVSFSCVLTPEYDTLAGLVSHTNQKYSDLSSIYFKAQFFSLKKGKEIYKHETISKDR